MRLDKALVEQGFCESRQEAKELIIQGFVTVNGDSCQKPSKEVVSADKLHTSSTRKYVSRGGEKLEGIFYTLFSTKDSIIHFLKNKIAVDIGSSTGGFSDFLLQHDITSLTCIDVGTAQLHEKIRSDSRVLVRENTDIRSIVASLYDIIVVDLSFISLEKVFDILLSYGKDGSCFFILLKPQFEVGKGNTKKGVVKDTESITIVIEKYTKLAIDRSLQDILITPCVVKGGDGNQEYFLTFKI